MAKPVQNLVIYRPKAGKEKELQALVQKHWPAVQKAGLGGTEPARVWKAKDIRKGDTFFVEIFSWKDEGSARVAHETPEVMAVWEPMEGVLEDLTITNIEPVG